ncbi:MAG: winged helix-turn-helix domain-containing protein [Firmicutes bacterium]|nr:winged helix-turn-helix domain-containing protein [Bacillota bacterium]
MLTDILKIIDRDGYISRSELSRELDVYQSMIDDGITELLRMGYLLEVQTGEDCPTVCAGCPFAKQCSKEIVKTFQVSDKGRHYLEGKRPTVRM